MRVIIVGAGIVGLSAAYALRKRQIDVTLVERGTIPGHLAASNDHHRLIRSYYGDSEGYCARVADAYAAWRKMWRDLNQPNERYYVERGMLAVCREEGDITDQSRKVMERLNIPFERIDTSTEIARRFPFLNAGGASYAMLSEGGPLMANRIMIDLAEWLRTNGALVREHSPVESIDEVAGRVTLVSGEILEGDKVLVCAGVETSKLVPDLSVILKPTRCLIVYAEHPKDLHKDWVDAPCWANLGGDTELWGVPPIDGLPLKLGNGKFGTQDIDDNNRVMTPKEIAAMLKSYEGYLKGVERFRVRWGQANYWTLAPKSEFFLEQRDKLLAVSACSGHGFKFGALTGEDLADAILETQAVEAVAARLATRPQ